MGTWSLATMGRYFGLALILAACSSGPAVPDGGKACSSRGDCPTLRCVCPQYYQACVGGLCVTDVSDCPAPQATQVGQACANDCECQSGACAVDTQTCCPSSGGGASGASCKHDCDCTSVHCSGDSCQ